MKALRTKTASELDNPARWHLRLRPWFDVASYQRRINDRAGLNRDGQPIVRLVWGQDVTQTAFYETTPRYWTRRQKAYPGYRWWTVPRWIFERRMEPEQYVDAWNQKRYSITDPALSGPTKCEDCGSTAEPRLVNGQMYCQSCVSTNLTGGAVIDKGPPPAEYYIFMMECAVHEGLTAGPNGWPACCTRSFYNDRMRCWGEYRPPNDFDLQVIEQATRAAEADKFRDPYRPMTTSELAETELAANMQVERFQEEFDKYEAEMMKEFNRLHGWRITGGSAPAFIDYGAGKTEGGLVLPQFTKET